MEATWDNIDLAPPKVRVSRAGPRTPRDGFLSLFVYDADCPQPYDRTQAPYMLYASGDAPCSVAAANRAYAPGTPDADLKRTWLPYEPPVQGKTGIEHRIMLVVMRHAQPVGPKLVGGEGEQSPPARGKFQLNHVKQKYGMELHQRNYFMIEA